MKVVQTFQLPVPPQQAAKVLISEEYNIDREKLRDGVISTEYVLQEENDRGLVFEMRTREHQRKKTGGFDTSKETVSHTINRWSEAEKKLTWDYKGQDEKVRLSGMYFLSENGNGTRVTHEVTVEVKIPLIGKQIAKLIASTFKKRDPRYDTIFKKHLKNQ